ncbi:unnamed protein product [Mycena citricolor]|uniref:Cytochrome P450 n=1 Tax=Mycena citricolor TaxID=2018698 RepID=A0AAD2HQ04_9AGAR|nr:unnamed protein product [Mycena citricolor]
MQAVRSLDWIGVFLSVGMVTLFLIPIQWGGNVRAWNDPVVIALLVLSGLFLLAFIAWELKTGENSILPLAMFTRRNLLGPCIEGFFVNICFILATYYLPFIYQLRGHSATRSGIDIIPFMMNIRSVFIPPSAFSHPRAAALCSGIVITKFGRPWPFLFFGPMVGAIGSGLLFTLNGDSSTGRIIGYQLVLGVGLGVTLQNTMVVVQADFAKEEALLSRATSVVTFTQTLGAAVGLAIGGAVFSTQLKHHLGEIAGIDPTAIATALSSIKAVFSFPIEIRDLVLTGYIRLRYGSTFKLNVGLRNLYILSSTSMFKDFFFNHALDHREPHFRALVALGSSGDVELLSVPVHEQFLPTFGRNLSRRAIANSISTPLYAQLRQRFRELSRSGHTSHQLADVIGRTLYSTLTSVIFGPSFPLDTYDDFITLDDAMTTLMSPIAFTAVGAKSARNRLLKVMVGYIEENGPFADTSVEIVSSALKSVETLPLHEKAVCLLSLLWSVNSNLLKSIWWMMAYLANDAEARESLVAEIRNTVEEQSDGDLLSMLAADKELLFRLFPCADAAVTETLRLCTLPGSLRVVARDFEFPTEDKGSSISLRVGDLLMANHRPYHFDDDVYPDAGKFKADRFVEKTDTAPTAKIMSWGSGAHMCKGRIFAHHVMKVWAIAFLQSFEFSSAEKVPELAPGSGNVIADFSRDIVVNLTTHGHLKGYRPLLDPHSLPGNTLPANSWSMGFMWPWIQRKTAHFNHQNDLTTLIPLVVGNPMYIAASTNVARQLWVNEIKNGLERPADFTTDGVWGSSIASANGDDWRRHRRIVAPAFTQNMYLMFSSVRFVSVADFFVRFTSIVNESSSVYSDMKKEFHSGQTITNLHALLLRFTLVMICRSGFGIEVDWKQRSGSSNSASIFDRALSLASKTLIVRLISPKWLWKLPFKTLKDINESWTTVISLSNELAAQRQTEYSIDKAAGVDDVADIFTKLVSTLESDAKYSLDPPEVTANMLSLLFAGNASALMSTIVMLGLHPDIQETAYQEILQNVSSPDNLNLNEIQDLKYVLACMNEAHRLIPATINLTRDVPNDIVLRSERPVQRDIVIQKGSRIMLDIMAICHNPHDFPSPEKYNPERWSSVNDTDVIMFGAGPRSCVGRRFAQTEAVVFLAHLLHDWRIETVINPGESHEGAMERILAGASMFGTAFALGEVPVRLVSRDQA